MSPDTYTVLVVSANRRLQGVLPGLLARQATLAYEGSVANVTEALMRAATDLPDIMVSDLPPVTARDVLAWRAIREAGPRILMLTRYMERGDDLRAVLAGAAGLILVPERKLQESIMRAAAGEQLRSPELAGRLGAIVSGEAPSPLNGEERRVFGLVADGHTDHEIAARLRTSPDEVRDHIARIAEKLS